MLKSNLYGINIVYGGVDLAETYILFVYGSLLKGQYGHEKYMQSAKYIEDAEINGDLRFFTSEYPVMILNDSKTYVKGELYEVDAETLEKIRDFEGLNERFTWYEESDISAYGIQAKVFTVKKSLSFPILFISEHIPHGSWRRFKEAPKSFPIPIPLLYLLAIASGFGIFLF